MVDVVIFSLGIFVQKTKFSSGGIGPTSTLEHQTISSNHRRFTPYYLVQILKVVEGTLSVDRIPEDVLFVRPGV